MILIEVEDNPNCRGVPQMSYAEMDPAQQIKKVRTQRKGVLVECWITGVEEGGKWCPAFAQKVVDSGSAYAFVVTGGAWGLRLQREDPSQHPWNLNEAQQWGEAYLLLAEESDLCF